MEITKQGSHSFWMKLQNAELDLKGAMYSNFTELKLAAETCSN